jgi:hypothetical protein
MSTIPSFQVPMFDPPPAQQISMFDSIPAPTRVMRSMVDVRLELERIHDKTKIHNVKGMCQALDWGLYTNRACYILESHLFQEPDLEMLVWRIASRWDGQDGMSGALSVAQKFLEKPFEG